MDPERTPPATQPEGLPPLIPRELLFGNPTHTEPRLSPDGARLAYLAPDNRGVLQVWTRTLGQRDDRALTADPARGIRLYLWAYDGERLGYLQDAGGDENWRLHAVELSSGEDRDLTPFEGVQAQVVARDPDQPDRLLVALNREDPSRHDVHRLDLPSGALELDTPNPGSVASWTADAGFRVRAAVAGTADGGSELLVRDAPDAPWRVARRWGPDDTGRVVGFSSDGDTLYMGGSHDADTVRLLAHHLPTGEETVLAEDPGHDLWDVLYHPTRRVPQAAAFYAEELRWEALDPDVEADFAALGALTGGPFEVVDRDLADAKWVIAREASDGPTRYYIYDRATRTAELLFSDRPELEGLALAPKRPVSYAARDGLTIHGYLTLPPGVPPRGLPAVLLVHGGPWARDTAGFDPNAQWLANRGYAVLQPNFRGSTGYGKAFMNAGDREWGARMHDDLVDGVGWLVGEGIADPARVAIMGGSYGGYATLAALAFTPEVFAAGVDIVGPSSLATLLESIPPYWAPLRAMLLRRVGDPEADAELLRERSPLHSAERIRAPLLIAQGANDPRVKQAESEQIVEAMRRAGRPVEYVLYTDEGHGFARPQNRLHFYARAEAFLARHLGGCAEPEGELEGNSAVVK